MHILMSQVWLFILNNMFTEYLRLEYSVSFTIFSEFVNILILYFLIQKNASMHFLNSRKGSRMISQFIYVTGIRIWAWYQPFVAKARHMLLIPLLGRQIMGLTDQMVKPSMWTPILVKDTVSIMLDKQLWKNNSRD